MIFSLCQSIGASIVVHSFFSGAGVGGCSNPGAYGLRLCAGAGRFGRLGQAGLDLHGGSADPGSFCFICVLLRDCPFVVTWLVMVSVFVYFN